MTTDNDSSSNTTCLVLLFMFLSLVLLLVYLYRRLNRVSKGEYTVRKLVLGEGGLRDQMRSGVIAVETRLGVHLWPRPRGEEEAVEDGQQATETDVEKRQSQEDMHDEREEAVQCTHEGEEDESSEDDYSSMDGENLRERAGLMEDKDEEEGRGEGEGQEDQPEKGREEVVVEVGEGEKNGEGLGLLVNLQEFSGSAIWSGKERDESKDSDMTAL